MRAGASVEEIQRAIVRRICCLDAPPGSQLKEAALAREFGVSRTPVRDAISRIKHLGLVETINGVGTVVVERTGEEIRQIYEMRLRLAPMIGALSARAVTAEDLRRVAALREDAAALEAAFDARAYFEVNDRLQALVAGLIGNAVLRSFWRQTYYQAASAWYRVALVAGAEAAEALVRELAEMEAALAQGDMAAVGHVQRVHVGYGYGRILRHLGAPEG